MVCAKRLGGNEQILTEATKATIVAMKHYYPYLADAEINIIKNLQKEQYIFSQTLERGHILFDEAVKNNDLNPSTIFKLVETFGFPFELIEELARRQNIKIDKNKFDEFLQHHKEISRGEISHAKKINLQNESLLNFKLKSVFDYDKLELNNSKVIGLFDEQFKQVEKNKGKSWLVFDHTVMYATSGGQVHDQGIVKFKNHDYHVIDVVKGPNFQHFICIDTKANEITVGDVALQIVDKQFRLNVARNHTSEHLIQYILQTKINKNIKQEGAFKSNEKVTFDFKYENKINEQQISLIELSINDLINSNIEVKTKLQTLDEAKKEGAIAYFDDVYAKIKDKLRVVSIGTISKEICGGTHVSNLSQIEQLMIAKITSKGINS
jgi:alanyl-tRNA synthetase